MQDITLTEWRKALSLSVEELANLLGVSPIELAAWERDEASCPYQRMLELAMSSIEDEKSAYDFDEAELDRKIERWEAEAGAKYYEENKEKARLWLIEHNKEREADGLKPIEFNYPPPRVRATDAEGRLSDGRI